MTRIYLEHIGEGEIAIRDQRQVHYLKDVLRLKPGGQLVVFNGKGKDVLCRVKEIAPQAVFLEAGERLAARQGGLSLTVACAIPKKARFEDAVDKLAQLGAEKIIPLHTARSIVKLDERREKLRLEHWRKIALAAAQQSQRSIPPKITPVKTLAETLAACAGYELKLIPHLGGKRVAFKQALARKTPRRALLLIGPEGDFTPEEVRMAIRAGCVAVSLGPYVLRVDTAAIACAAFIKLYYTDGRKIKETD
jgi:16S rRNA (uracil1498-N3)-methyltransferase